MGVGIWMCVCVYGCMGVCVRAWVHGCIWVHGCVYGCETAWIYVVWSMRVCV
jgi:hypothetical protein